MILTITIARKPLAAPTVAANVLKWQTGGLNIEQSRIGTEGATKRSHQEAYPKQIDGTEDKSQSWARTGHLVLPLQSGRWPANLSLTESPPIFQRFPITTSGARDNSKNKPYAGPTGWKGTNIGGVCGATTGPVSRYFKQVQE